MSGRAGFQQKRDSYEPRFLPSGPKTRPRSFPSPQQGEDRAQRELPRGPSAKGSVWTAERQRSGEELKPNRENRAVHAQESPGSGERRERCSTSGAWAPSCGGSDELLVVYHQPRLGRRWAWAYICQPSYPPSPPAGPLGGEEQPGGDAWGSAVGGQRGRATHPWVSALFRLRRLTGEELRGSTDRLHGGEALGRLYGHPRYSPFIRRLYYCSRTCFPEQNGGIVRVGYVKMERGEGEAAYVPQACPVLGPGSFEEFWPRESLPARAAPGSGRRRAEPPVLPALLATWKAAVICKSCVRIFKRTEFGP